jgi:hypothetical protein
VSTDLNCSSVTTASSDTIAKRAPSSSMSNSSTPDISTSCHHPPAWPRPEFASRGGGGCVPCNRRRRRVQVCRLDTTLMGRAVGPTLRWRSVSLELTDVRPGSFRPGANPDPTAFVYAGREHFNRPSFRPAHGARFGTAAGIGRPVAPLLPRVSRCRPAKPTEGTVPPVAPPALQRTPGEVVRVR